MDRKTFNKIVDILAPHMTDKSSRRSFVSSALLDSPLLSQIDWGGDATTFTTRLVRQCDRYSLVQGNLAIVMLLRTLKDRTHSVTGAEIDTLIDEIQRNSSPQAKKRVYIIHSEQDAGFVQLLSEDLESVGIETVEAYLGLRGYLPWNNNPEAAIKQANAVIFVATPEQNATDKLAIATRENKSIYPVWSSGELGKGLIPIRNINNKSSDDRSVAYVDMVKSNYRTGLMKLIYAIEAGNSAGMDKVMLDMFGNVVFEDQPDIAEVEPAPQFDPIAEHLSQTTVMTLSATLAEPEDSDALALFMEEFIAAIEDAATNDAPLSVTQLHQMLEANDAVSEANVTQNDGGDGEFYVVLPQRYVES